MGRFEYRFHRKRKDVFEGVPVFSIMRNEKYFLPHFLRHYRLLGARSFIIFADRCDDEFLSMLEAAEDVSIIRSEGARFGDVFGVQENGRPKRLSALLKEYVANRLLFNRWHAVADSDEFIVLPPPFAGLEEYTAFLERRKAGYCFASMVDFYPRKLAERNFDPQVNPFLGCPYFDEGPYHAIDHDLGSLVIRSAGVRGRMLNQMLKDYPVEMKDMGVGPDMYLGALNYKFPIMKSSEKLQRVGDHRISKLTTIGHACAIAHFKFYPELDEKVATAMAEGQYFAGSVEYKFLNFVLEKLNTANLLCRKSRKYLSPEDMVSANILQADVSA